MNKKDYRGALEKFLLYNQHLMNSQTIHLQFVIVYFFLFLSVYVYLCSVHIGMLFICMWVHVWEGVQAHVSM